MEELDILRQSLTWLLASSSSPVMQPPCGVLVLDKPRGTSSHDIVMRTRRTFGVRQIGHMGTLDPMATGVLLVAIGEATKLGPWLTRLEKCYEATIALGVETDTLDAEGRETKRTIPTPALRAALAQSSPSFVSPLLRNALEQERARTTQVPPAYSAIHCEGERAYKRARRGEEVDLPARPVGVHRLELLVCRAEPPTIEIAVAVTKGYYVRSLARDLAAGLGTVAHLTALRRIRSGSFGLDEASSIETPVSELATRIVPLSSAASRVLPVLTLTDSETRDAHFGRPISVENFGGLAPGPYAWLDGHGRLVAIGEMDSSGRGRVLRGFVTQTST
jgi:tRNA pseudouridine55 synthase